MSAGGVRAGRAFVEIGADPREFNRALKNLQKNVSQLGRNLTRAGAALTAAGSAVVGSLAGAASRFAAAGDAIQKMALRTGLSTEALSALSFVAEQSGTDLGSLEKGIRRMQSTILDASMGLSTATDALGMLGLAFGDLQGMSPEDQFMRLVAALGNVEDASTRAALAQRIFGRAGTALLPMIDAGEAGMAELTREAERLGLIFDQETADKAAALTDAMNSLKRGFDAIIIQIGGAVAPIFTEFSKTLSVVAGRISFFVKQNGDFIRSALKIGGTIAVVGGALTGLGLTLQAAAFSFSGLAGAANLVIAPLRGIAVATAGIVSWLAQATAATVAYAARSIASATATAAAWAVANAPIIAIGAALGGAATVAVSAAGGFSQLGRSALSALDGIGGMASSAGAAIGNAFSTVVADARVVFSDLYSTATTAFGGISDALAVGDFAGAAQVAWLGLQAVWQRGIMAIMSYTDPFIEYLQNIWGTFATFTLNAIDGLWGNLKNAFNIGLAVLLGVTDNFINGMMATWDGLVAAIRKSWNYVQSFFVRGFDLEKENKKVDDEMSARALARSRERPGVGGRMAVAERENRENNVEVRRRQDRRIEANEQAQTDRAQRTEDRAAQRQANLDSTVGELEATRNRLGANRQAVDLLPQIAAAGTLDELRELAKEIQRLEEAGASAETIARLNEELDTRAGDLDDRRREEERMANRQAQAEAKANVDTAPPPPSGEVAGTFSAAAAAGLGFGSTLMDRIADASEETARNTRKIDQERVAP